MAKMVFGQRKKRHKHIHMQNHSLSSVQANRPKTIVVHVPKEIIKEVEKIVYVDKTVSSTPIVEYKEVPVYIEKPAEIITKTEVVEKPVYITQEKIIEIIKEVPKESKTKTYIIIGLTIMLGLSILLHF